jgi:hypothetical protein
MAAIASLQSTKIGGWTKAAGWTEAVGSMEAIGWAEAVAWVEAVASTETLAEKAKRAMTVLPARRGSPGAEVPILVPPTRAGR